MTKDRFYIDHGVIHDRHTGKHVVTDGEPPFEDGIEQVCELLNSLHRSSEQNAARQKASRDCYETEGCPHWAEACTRYQRAEARLARATGELERLFELFGHQATADVLASVSSPVTENDVG